MLGLIFATISAPQNEMSLLLGNLLIASLPAFLSGTLEDLTKKVGPLVRLWASMASGVLVWWLTGYSLTEVNVWGVDALLTWLPISVMFTAFAVAGVANAMNVIDGLNGLAGGVMLIAMIAFALMAYAVGDNTLVKVCLLVGVTVIAFLVFNFPFGKLFLGDGGAYLLGFMGAALAVILAMRNPVISVWAPLLVFSYPILEVLFSILRRRSRAHHPYHPDRLHLHSLIQARLFKNLTRNWPKRLQNAFGSILPWCLMSLGAALGVLFAHSTPILMVCFVLMAVVYWLGYAYLIRFGRIRRQPRSARLV
jgi:UDP-N-acetylmuramyl pentapeptide phosphotransferase/UDP-N-acetylglucosamine-1-phosphate transferase